MFQNDYIFKVSGVYHTLEYSKCTSHKLTQHSTYVSLGTALWLSTSFKTKCEDSMAKVTRPVYFIINPTIFAQLDMQEQSLFRRGSK